MMNIRVAPFTAWALAGVEQDPTRDESHVDDGWIVGASVYHGQVRGDGVGAIVTSYNPQTSFMDYHRALATGGHLALGQLMARQFTDDALGGLVELSALPTIDLVLRCGEQVVPALEIGFGLPGVTLIVSLDLAAYPVVIGLWQWPEPVSDLGLRLERSDIDWAEGLALAARMTGRWA